MVSMMTGTNNYREALALLEWAEINPFRSGQKIISKGSLGRAMELINDEELESADALLIKSWMILIMRRCWQQPISG